MCPDWEGPKRQKQPKQRSGRPDGPTVGMAVTLFLVVPAAVCLTIGLYLLNGYNVI